MVNYKYGKILITSKKYQKYPLFEEEKKSDVTAVWYQK